MRKISRRVGAAVGLAGFATSVGAGCAVEDDGLATLRLALDIESHGSFELKVFKGTPDENLDGDVAFDSGCVVRQSTVFEISDLPVGDEYAITYTAYPTSDCSNSRIAFGFRGGVSLAKGDNLYVHVPVYEMGEGNVLPSDLNLSSLGATAVASCDDAAACAGALNTCVTSGDKAWCVPTCQSNGDCASLHDQATCDTETNWCMLASPWPLNASEPRLFGRAMTRANGDVVVIGGLMPDGDGAFGPTRFPVERFDAATGVFGSYDLVGFDGRPAAAFGFAKLGADSAAVAGGVTAATNFTVAGGLEADMRTDGVDKAFVIDFASGRAASAPLGRVVIEPAVFAIDASQFAVVGGHEGRPGNALAGADKTSICAVDASGALTCEAGPDLKAARVAPALVCVEASNGVCATALVFGGNVGGGPLAELLDLSGDNAEGIAVTTTGLPPSIRKPVLCGARLVGGAAGNESINSLVLDVAQIDDAKLGVASVESGSASLPVWAGFTDDGCGLVAGGTEGSGATGKGVWAVSEGSFGRLGDRLGVSRVGAAVGRIGSGPLAGVFVILGGTNLDGGSGVITGAEIWRNP